MVVLLQQGVEQTWWLSGTYDPFNRPCDRSLRASGKLRQYALVFPVSCRRDALHPRSRRKQGVHDRIDVQDFRADLRAISHRAVGRARQSRRALRGQKDRAVGAAQCAAVSRHVSACAPGARGDRSRRQCHRAPCRSRAAGIRQYRSKLCRARASVSTKAIEFVKGFKPAQIDGSEDKAIKITFPSGATRDFTGQSLLLGNSLPNFYFHCTTAYDILRHCGVELGKRDFMGTPVNL